MNDTTTPDTNDTPPAWPFDDGPIRSWARDGYANGAHVQAQQTAQAKGVVHPVAVMPDAHKGMGACIGTVVATENTIIPACVGVDLGCGLSAVRLNVNENQLPDTLEPVLSAFAEAVPAKAHPSRHGRVAGEKQLTKLGPAPSGLADMGRAATQVGTLGSGNHFLEASTDREGQIWIVVHSGSRGVGHYLARQHIAVAKELDKEAPSKDLAALTATQPEFDAYVADMLWAQDYAFLNRETMLSAAVAAFADATGMKCRITSKVRCHHNYATKETHDGRELWLTRKGAIRADIGDYGIIPGSMGTSTFIVRGLGNPAAYCSASHGAGRVMSRTKAKTCLSVDDLRTQMAGRVWSSDKARSLIDEAPDAYKNIDDVMEWQTDLCSVENELTAIVNYKGV